MPEKVQSRGFGCLDFLDFARVDDGAENGVDGGIYVAREPDFEFRAFHFRLQVRLQIGRILHLDIAVGTVGDHSDFPGIADFDLPDVGVFKNGLLHKGHIDVFLARSCETNCCTKEKDWF